MMVIFQPLFSTFMVVGKRVEPCWRTWFWLRSFVPVRSFWGRVCQLQRSLRAPCFCMAQTSPCLNSGTRDVWIEELWFLSIGRIGGVRMPLG